MVTNDNDKLRTLLVWANELRASKSFAGAFIAQELENRVNALLNEPPSPAPAAAPSDVEIAAAEQEADEIVAKAKNDNTAQPVGLSKHLRRRISEALMRRAADAKEQTK